MASAVATKLAKPQLRGHFNHYLNMTFIYATVGAAISGAGYYYFGLLKHRNRREEFFRTFNQEKEFERLRDLGFFWSVPPKDPEKAFYKYQKEDD